MSVVAFTREVLASSAASKDGCDKGALYTSFEVRKSVHLRMTAECVEGKLRRIDAPEAVHIAVAAPEVSTGRMRVSW